MRRVLESVAKWLPFSENWIFNHVTHLPERYEPWIICGERENAKEFDLERVKDLTVGSLILRILWRLAGRAGLGRLIMRSFARRANAGIGAKMIHSHFGPTGWRNVLAAEALNLKHIVSFYGYDVGYLPATNPRWRTRYKDMFEKARCIICEGEFMGKSLADLGCPFEKIRIVRLGVDLEKFRFKMRNWNQQGTIKVLIASRFSEKKGITYALQALARVSEVMPFEITLIGDAGKSDGPREKATIERLLKRCGFGCKISRLGFVPHQKLIETGYENHVYLAPSVTTSLGDCEGGAPVSIIEMAATGSLIISSVHCDIPNVIDSGRTGILVAERDVEGLAAALLWVHRNRNESKDMTVAACQAIEAKFDVRKQATVLGSVYDEIWEQA